MVRCVAPIGTPAPIVEALSAGTVEMNTQARMSAFVDKFGLDNRAQGRADFGAFIREKGAVLFTAA